MSDDLVKRLVDVAVTAAEEKINSMPPTDDTDRSFRLMQAASSSAVLRELADYVRDGEPDGKQAPGYDEGWADAYGQVANDIEALADWIDRSKS